MDEVLRRLDRIRKDDPDQNERFYFALIRSGNLHWLRDVLLTEERARSYLRLYIIVTRPEVLEHLKTEPLQALPIYAWMRYYSLDPDNHSQSIPPYIPPIYPWFYWRCGTCGDATDKFLDALYCCNSQNAPAVAQQEYAEIIENARGDAIRGYMHDLQEDYIDQSYYNDLVNSWESWKNWVDFRF